MIELVYEDWQCVEEDLLPLYQAYNDAPTIAKKVAAVRSIIRETAAVALLNEPKTVRLDQTQGEFIYPDGTTAVFTGGVLGRDEDLPSVVLRNGVQVFIVDECIKRTNGKPPIIFEDGRSVMINEDRHSKGSSPYLLVA